MKVQDIKELGTIIRKRRVKTGYTQGEVSEYTGMSVSFISEVENGKETAQIGKVLKLMHVLGMDMDIEERG